jgi:hypothetical protein
VETYPGQGAIKKVIEDTGDRFYAAGTRCYRKEEKNVMSFMFTSTVHVIGEYLASVGDYDVARSLVESALSEINNAECLCRAAAGKITNPEEHEEMQKVLADYMKEKARINEKREQKNGTDA